ncbi:hypothetical protein H9P43_009468 [Blastocladiella emersonii ATCC 22665]|nr:hypothetical protein H9P43_009468 [Blastocladiella emersonii ATCC 22665]
MHAFRAAARAHVASASPAVRRRAVVAVTATAATAAAVWVAAKDDDDADLLPSSLAPLAAAAKRWVGPSLGSGAVLADAAVKVEKPRLVVLGSGWGATSLLRSLDADPYDVTVVSPTNNFYYTPLLPSACVGTVEDRSLVEPVRRILSTSIPSARFVYGAAEDIDVHDKHVHVRAVDGADVVLHYDVLVVAVGSESSTFGLPGVKEHCHFLKSVADARAIRKHILANFERAALPTTPPDEQKRLLTFVICGAGPTGSEFAGEFHDLLGEDLARYYPALVPLVSVHLVQSGEHILNTFDKRISEYAAAKFRRAGINVVTHARVNRVSADEIGYTLAHPDGRKTQETIKHGFCLWAAGVGMRPIVRKFADAIDAQTHARMLAVDDGLAVLGAQDVYAVGDCAAIANPRFLDRLAALFAEADTDGDGALTRDEYKRFAHALAQRHPTAETHLAAVDVAFDTFDADGSQTLSAAEFRALLADVDTRLKSLPATAQVAAQQGKYLGHKLSALRRVGSEAAARQLFRYRHLGSLAYVGGEEGVADFGAGMATGGAAAAWLWRGAYFSEQVAMRTRFLLAADWVKTKVFGRDISDI